MGDSEKSETHDQDAEGPQSVTHRSQPTTTVPLISLVPAQHRHAVKRASLKAIRGNDGLKSATRHAVSGIRVRHSAPGQTLKASPSELRVSKSAPDLRAPVLAAIKGLQDGSLQVDIRTRSKIANAARKVLEAREQRRRVKQDIMQGASQEATREALPHTMPSSEPRHTVASAGKGADKSLSIKDAAAPEGEDSEKITQVLETSTASLASFPFIVTTGMPKYAEGHVAVVTSPRSSLSGIRSDLSASVLDRTEKHVELEPSQEKGDSQLERNSS